MDKNAIAYALAKQVPDMSRGFTIATSYGDITIPPGWMADRIRESVERVLQCEDKELQSQPELPPAEVRAAFDSIFGGLSK